MAPRRVNYLSQRNLVQSRTHTTTAPTIDRDSITDYTIYRCRPNRVGATYLVCLSFPTRVTHLLITSDIGIASIPVPQQLSHLSLAQRDALHSSLSLAQRDALHSSHRRASYAVMFSFQTKLWSRCIRGVRLFFIAHLNFDLLAERYRHLHPRRAIARHGPQHVVFRRLIREVSPQVGKQHRESYLLF